MESRVTSHRIIYRSMYTAVDQLLVFSFDPAQQVMTQRFNSALSAFVTIRAERHVRIHGSILSDIRDGTGRNGMLHKSNATEFN